MLKFNISGWAGYASGLHTQEAWRAWARQPCAPVGLEPPALTDVPAMARRRIDPLGRMAVQVALWCQKAEDNNVPLIFASRYGDIVRTHDLLKELVNEGVVSPTSFGLAVHNAIAAQYSMLRSNHGNYTALGAGTATAEAALLEAAGLLAEGTPEVLVVAYDALVPEVFSEFLDEAPACYAWAWNVRPDQGEGMRIGLETDASVMSALGSALPHMLDVHRFVISDDTCLTHRTGNTGWRWHRLSSDA